MTSKNFSYDDFLEFASVSRETYSRLQNYHLLLEKWQSTINLIGNLTVREIWTRHIIDSCQLLRHISESESVVDLGSGAGFPGLIMAIMGKENITLVESDVRKVAFLREAARVTNADVNIVNIRAETLDLYKYSLITARAFAPLPTLLEIVGSTLKATHKMLLLKGKKYLEEIQQARAGWSFEYQAFPSITDPEGVVLSLHNFNKTSVS